MSEKVSKDQYGRKTWNVDAYAEDAKRRKVDKHSTSDKAIAAVESLKGQTYLQHRSDLLQESVLAVKKHTLISSELNTSSTYGKNKRFGFFCPVCDLSFRDTLALVDHINSPQHTKNVQALAHKSGTAGDQEEIGGVKRASAEEVALVIEDLVKKLLQAKAAETGADSLQTRIRKRQEFEAKRLADRKLRRKRDKQKKAAHPVETNDEVAAAMGFHGFGTTKTA